MLFFLDQGIWYRSSLRRNFEMGSYDRKLKGLLSFKDINYFFEDDKPSSTAIGGKGCKFYPGAI